MLNLNGDIVVDYIEKDQSISFIKEKLYDIINNNIDKEQLVDAIMCNFNLQAIGHKIYKNGVEQ